MMTRKDYIKFAEVFRHWHQTLKENPDIYANEMLKALEEDVADIFLQDNERFDYKKFIKYIRD